jgi:Flp pilus assembly protein TadB
VVAPVNAQLPLLVAACGLGSGLGAWLVIDGLTRRRRPAGGGSGSQLWRRIASGGTTAAAAGAVTAATVIGAWTRWPVAAVLAGAAAWALPGLLTGARRQQEAQRRLEAIATWTESLRGTLQAAAGLEQAITTTATTAPEPIRPQVSALAQALHAGLRAPEALRAFAADLDHPDADRVVAALLLAATGRARNLADQLGALAAAAREQAAAHRRVHTEWATIRTSVRVIIAITVVMAAGQILLNRSFLEPYDTPGGQVVLAVVGVLFGLGFWWLARLSRISQPPRTLAGGPAGEVER